MNNNEKKLLRAAKIGDVNEVRKLIDQGVDVNVKDDDNEIAWVPLLLASRSGHAGVVQLLLERGADVNAKSSSEQTALHGAAWTGHGEVAQVLLHYGADVNARNKFGQTPLHWAAHYAHAHIVALLLENGADSQARNENGETPLDKVRAKTNKPRERGDIVRLLQGKSSDTLLTIFFCKIGKAVELNEWFSKMVESIQNVHECKIFYSIVRTAIALKICGVEQAREWIERAIDKAAAGCSAEGSFTAFHAILCKAYQDEMIDEDTFSIFDEYRRSTTRTMADQLLDLKTAIQKSAARINGLEGTVESIQTSLRFFLWKLKLLKQAAVIAPEEEHSDSVVTTPTRSSTTVSSVVPTARQYLTMKIDAMIGLIGGILNAILLGRESDPANFAHMVSTAVDFSDAPHLRQVIQHEFVPDLAKVFNAALQEGMDMAVRILELPPEKSSTSRRETAKILRTATSKPDPIVILGLCALYLEPDGVHKEKPLEAEDVTACPTVEDSEELAEAMEWFRDAMLSDEDEEQLALHAAVKFGDAEAVDKALSDAVSSDTVNILDACGRTALDLAALTGQVELMTRIHNRGGQAKALKSWARLRATARKRQAFAHLYPRIINKIQTTTPMN